MMRIYKKQVKAILKLITSFPCQSRPALKTMRLKRDGFAYITNGYMAVRFELEIKPVPKDDNQTEFIIPAENLEKWYKTAKSSDYLDEVSILALQDTEDSTVYPDIAQVIKLHLMSNLSNKDIYIDESLLKLFTGIVNDESILIKHYDKCVLVKSLKNPEIDGVIMELNK